MKKKIKNFLANYHFQAKDQSQLIKKNADLTKNNFCIRHKKSEVIFFKVLSCALTIILLLIIIIPSSKSKLDANKEYNKIFEYDGSFNLEIKDIRSIKKGGVYLNDEEMIAFVDFFNSLEFSYLVPNPSVTRVKYQYFEVATTDNSWIGITIFVNDIIRINDSGEIVYFLVPSVYQSLKF